MRLARKLTLFLLLGIGAVFTVHTVVSIRSHIGLHRADVSHDERVMGRALASSIAAAWQVQGPGAALAILEATDRQEDDVALRWVPLPGGQGSESATPLDPDLLHALAHGQQVTLVRPGREGPVVHTYTAVRLGEGLVGAVELSEPLAEGRYLSWRIRRQLVTATAMVLVCGALSWLVGARLVGRPIQQLVEKARRIGTGDFSDPLVLRQRDELSDLSLEMNAMAERLDLALRKGREEMEARLAAVEQLRHADRLTTVGQLAAGVAHELGTPLNVVSGRAKMILTGEVDEPEDVRKLAKIIVEQSQRIAGIVRELLDFARRNPGRKRQADLGSLAHQTLDLLNPFATQRGVELTLEAPEIPLEAEVEAGQIQQALTNVTMNALQASRRGSRVAVRIARRRKCHPQAPGGSEHECALIEVRDEGTGIPAEQLPRVFDPFFTTKPLGEGTGLGLSVSWAIVSEHGGWIDVSSEPGRGSAFTLVLPLGRPRG